MKRYVLSIASVMVIAALGVACKPVDSTENKSESQQSTVVAPPAYLTPHRSCCASGSEPVAHPVVESTHVSVPVHAGI